MRPSSDGNRQRGEQIDAPAQHAVGIREGLRDLRRCSGGFGRVGNAPMRRHAACPGHTGQASPAALSQTVEMKSNSGAPGLRKFVPGL